MHAYIEQSEFWDKLQYDHKIPVILANIALRILKCTTAKFREIKAAIYIKKY
jgi:hypothetical protein